MPTIDDLIRSAITDALAPLAARLDALERGVSPTPAPPPAPAPLDPVASDSPTRATLPSALTVPSAVRDRNVAELSSVAKVAP